jgi:hypothetical protein
MRCKILLPLSSIKQMFKFHIQSVLSSYINTSVVYSRGNFQLQVFYEHESDYQRSRSSGQKFNMIRTAQNTITYVHLYFQGHPTLQSTHDKVPEKAVI